MYGRDEGGYREGCVMCDEAREGCMLGILKHLRGVMINKCKGCSSRTGSLLSTPSFSAHLLAVSHQHERCSPIIFLYLLVFPWHEKGQCGKSSSRK